jgi:hypothetical protein
VGRFFVNFSLSNFSNTMFFLLKIIILDRSKLNQAGIEKTSLPFDVFFCFFYSQIVIELVLGSFLCCFSYINSLTSNWKPIFKKHLYYEKFSNFNSHFFRTFETINNRPNFNHFNHRGRKIFNENHVVLNQKEE